MKKLKLPERLDRLVKFPSVRDADETVPGKFSDAKLDSVPTLRKGKLVIEARLW